MNDKLKIFYAHSNHNNIHFATYSLVSNNINIINNNICLTLVLIILFLY